MTGQRRLMCVLAHPDDETLGAGGVLARYAAEGVGTHLVMATRGERGWLGPPEDYPGPEALGQVREQELHAAAAVLGVQEVSLLGYMDGELDQARPNGAITCIAGHLRRVRPQVVITFDPSGVYGHPDHIAICQFTSAAVVAAADPGFAAGAGKPHRVSKLYYTAESRDTLAAFERTFGELAMEVDGEERRPPGWAPWTITTRIDTAAYWQQVWQAIVCHCSQLPEIDALQALPEAQRRDLWSVQTFYRAFSLVNGGRQIERDLFEGLD